MKRSGNTRLEERFRQAFGDIEGYKKESVSVKASFGLIFLRGAISSKAQRLEIVNAALVVMDDVLGEGNRRITGSPR